MCGTARASDSSEVKTALAGFSLQTMAKIISNMIALQTNRKAWAQLRAPAEAQPGLWQCKRRKRRMLMRRPFAVFVALSLAACTAAAGSHSSLTMPALSDLTSFALMRADVSGTSPSLIGVDQAADLLKDYDVIFLGEWHDHPGNHLAEMALFRAIHQRAPRVALSMEQFERDVQPVLDDYMAGRIGEENLMSRGRAWSNYAESYRPLVEYAKENGLHVIAAEAPTR